VPSSESLPSAQSVNAKLGPVELSWIWPRRSAKMLRQRPPKPRGVGHFGAVPKRDSRPVLVHSLKPCAFHLISQNAADMIAVVDMEGRRIFNSLSYEKVIGYSPEELQSSSAFEQIHPMTASVSRRRLRTQSIRELEQHWSTASGTKTGDGWCWNPLRA